MSAIVQETSWSERHPNITRVSRLTLSGFQYTINGHIIVDFGRWLVLYCGRVSETAMLLATLWVTSTFVAPDLTNKLGDTGTTLSSLSLMAFSLLPEVILFIAIITTYHHWRSVIRQHNDVSAWIWAVLYSLPTGAFFGMTVYTICSFVSEHGHIQQATGAALVLRCLAGWFYSLVGLIHSGINKRTPFLVEQPETQVIPEKVISDLRDSFHAMYEPQMQELRNILQTMEAKNTQLTTEIETLKSAQTSITSEPINTTLVDQEIHTDSIPVVLTENRTTPRKKDTQKLPEIHTLERTDKRTTPNTKAGNEKALKAARVIARNPGITAPDLAKKAAISETYARQLLAKKTAAELAS